jgi:hypothetical protein
VKVNCWPLADIRPPEVVTAPTTLKVTVPLDVKVADPTAVIEAMPVGIVVGGLIVTPLKPAANVTETVICVVFPANTVKLGGTLRVKPGKLLAAVPLADGELKVPLSPLTLYVDVPVALRAVWEPAKPLFSVTENVTEELEPTPTVVDRPTRCPVRAGEAETDGPTVVEPLVGLSVASPDGDTVGVTVTVPAKLPFGVTVTDSDPGTPSVTLAGELTVSANGSITVYDCDAELLLPLPSLPVNVKLLPVAPGLALLELAVTVNVTRLEFLVATPEAAEIEVIPGNPLMEGGVTVTVPA